MTCKIRRAVFFLSFFVVIGVLTSCIKKGENIRVDVSRNAQTQPPAPPVQPPPPPPPSTPENVTIEGRVFLSGTGETIPGAIVKTSLDQQMARTDSSGHFLLQTATNGRGNYAKKPYTITISADGYQTFSQAHTWGDYPSNQLFYLQLPLDPYAHIKQIAALIVEKEYKNYLSRNPNEVPDLLGGQPSREQELQKAFQQENMNLKTSQTEEDKKFLEAKDKDKELSEKSLSSKSEIEQAKTRREWSARWEQSRAAKQRKQEEERFYLKGRQTLERKQLQAMFTQERAKAEGGEFDQSQVDKEYEDYLRKHALPAYLIALGQGKELLWPPARVMVKIEPQSIEKGKSAKLIWEAWDAEKEVTIEPEIGEVVGHSVVTKLKPLVKEGEKIAKPLVIYGSAIDISPQKTTVYKLTATGLDGKTVEATAEIKVTEPLQPSTVRWIGILDDRVGKSNNAVTADGEPDGVFELTLEGQFNDLVLMTADSEGKPCCGQQWDTISLGKPAPAGTLYSDPGRTWVLGILKEDGTKLINKPDGSIDPRKETSLTTVKLYAGNSNYFHKGQNFALFVMRPLGEIEKVYAKIETEPVIETVKHEPVQDRKFEIRSFCQKGKNPFAFDTHWAPLTIEVNQGDRVHLTVYGPPESSASLCYSVSFSIKEYGILLSKIVRGTKQETTFEATKNGQFEYVDVERGIREEKTAPGRFIVHKNIPPTQPAAEKELLNVKNFTPKDWTVENWYKPTDNKTEVSFESDGARFKSTSGNTRMGIMKTLDADVSSCNSLILTATVKADLQTLTGTGWQGRESPVALFVSYTDVNGVIHNQLSENPSDTAKRMFWHGFYYMDPTSPSLSVFGTKIPKGNWQSYSFDLMSLNPKPKIIHFVGAEGAGWASREGKIGSISLKCGGTAK